MSLGDTYDLIDEDFDPTEQDSLFSAGMQVSLDGAVATVIESLPATSLSLLCRVRTEINGVVREAVLKILRPENRSNAGHMRRFNDECKTASYLSGELNEDSVTRCVPDVCALVDSVSADSADLGSGIVMEYVRGSTLSQLYAQKGGPEAISKLMLPIACASAGILSRVHRAGIIHRDIKPDNFILRPDGRLCLLDFGVSCRRGELPHGANETFLGTIGYMPTEAFLDDQFYAPASDMYDLFGLGAMLHNLQSEPHEMSTVDSVGEYMDYLDRLRKHGFKAPSALHEKPLAPVVAKLLADPSGRYVSAQQLLADLNALVYSCQPAL